MENHWEIPTEFSWSCYHIFDEKPKEALSLIKHSVDHLVWTSGVPVHESISKTKKKKLWEFLMNDGDRRNGINTKN